MNMNNIIEKIKKDQIIGLIKDHADKILTPDADVYVVGGVIRDCYLEKENFDKDIIIDNFDAEKFAQSLAQSLEATFIVLDDVNKIYRLVLQDKINYIDVANVIGKSIQEDLLRRDLTINAIAINLKTFEILDFAGGILDLKSKKIRHISEKNLSEDPLRLLRVFRFYSVLGFELDKELTELLPRYSTKINNVALERINYELLKLFSGDFAHHAIKKMDEADLLEEILPLILDLKKVPPNSHHHLDLFSHSIETVKQIQDIYDKSCDEVKIHLDRVDFGGATRLAHLKLAGFLHDVGKFSTWTIEEENGKHRFIKHDDVGSKMVATFLKGAKFSKKQVEYISKMVKYHIYPSHVVCATDINDKIYMRLIRKMANDVVDVIILAKADRYSARGVEITEEIVNNNINKLNSLLEFYLKIKDELKPLPKLISGEEIMGLLNLKPSKELGAIIKSLQEAQISGDVVTKDEAVKFIKSK